MSEARADPPHRIESGPPGTRFSEVRWFAEIDSTNRYLVDVARAGAKGPLVAVADHQTAGRGRLGRRWETPPETNLLVSVLLSPALPPDELHLCSAAVALSAVEACHVLTGVEASLKWPNDLVVDGRKLAGVLAESVAEPGDGGARAVVVGIGVNVAWPPAEDDVAFGRVPAELRQGATSLAREARRPVDRGELLDRLLQALDGRAGALDDVAGRRRLAAEYRSRCGTVGEEVVVTLPAGEIRGRAADISVEGHLLVDTGACLTTVTAGDVVHVRRAYHGAP
ncbi:MAG: biotin--[acetyl-CoA-carboxylase] ligase [Acidimicrobiales bacterium]